MDYASLDDDQLFEQFRIAAINNEEGPGQRAAVKVLDAVMAETYTRAARDRWYHRFLTDSEPRVRFTAALALKKSDPKAAMAVFKALEAAHGDCSSASLLEIWGLQAEGY